MRRIPLLGALTLAGLLVTPPSMVGSAGPAASRFGGVVAGESWPPGEATVRSAWLTPRQVVTLVGGEPFGGLSALAVRGTAVDPRAIAVADTGIVARFPVRAGGGDRPARLRPLPPAPGDGSRKADRDSESLAAAPDGGWWVGFEHRNELRRYSADLARLTGRYRSRALSELPESSGLEALAGLPGRRMIGIAETVRGDGRSPAFLWSLDARGRIAGERRLWFRPPAGMRATDAVALDADELLVLVRRFAVPEGFTTALVLVPLAPRPGFGPTNWPAGSSPASDRPMTTWRGWRSPRSAVAGSCGWCRTTI